MYFRHLEARVICHDKGSFAHAILDKPCQSRESGTLSRRKSIKLPEATLLAPVLSADEIDHRIRDRTQSAVTKMVNLESTLHRCCMLRSGNLLGEVASGFENGQIISRTSGTVNHFSCPLLSAGRGTFASDMLLGCREQVVRGTNKWSLVLVGNWFKRAFVILSII